MSKNLKGFGIIIKIWLFYSLDNNLKTLLFNIDTMRNQRDVFDQQSVNSICSEQAVESLLSDSQAYVVIQCLQKRFPKYSISTILESLTQYLQSQISHHFVSQLQTNKLNNKRIEQKTQKNNFNILTKYIRPQDCLIDEGSIQKKKKIKIIAKLFAESGPNYTLAKYLIPNISIEEYKMSLEEINKETINAIESYLFQINKSCNQTLSIDEKQIMITQLIQVHTLFKNSNQNFLKVYVEFILSKYDQRRIESNLRQIQQLYTILIKIAKNPNIYLMGNRNWHKILSNLQVRQQIKSIYVSISNFSQQDQRNVIEGYLKYQSIEILLKSLNEKYSFAFIWTPEYVHIIIKNCIKKQLQKLIDHIDQHDQKLVNKFTSIFDDSKFIYDILTSQNLKELKRQILQLYILHAPKISDQHRVIQKFKKWYKSKDKWLPQKQIKIKKRSNTRDEKKNNFIEIDVQKEFKKRKANAKISSPIEVINIEDDLIIAEKNQQTKYSKLSIQKNQRNTNFEFIVN